jgi:pimeloyl-ACP methyl ester carboxylesterase
MARFTGELPAARYSPHLTVSARAVPEGGPVRNGLLLQPDPSLPTQRELLVLVHGFNNNLQEAQEAYAAFRDGQRSQLSPSDVSRLSDQLADCFWPGDADLPGPLDFLDFLVYPFAIPKGMATSRLLADYLMARPDAETVHFVGHSMGCRVILETIQHMLAAGPRGKKVGRVCLMAAAVPTFKVCPGGELYGAFIAAERMRVLYSPDDKVLSFAFPLGQTAARGDEGFLPTAVGHGGDIPSHPPAAVAQRIEGAGHGDYWGIEADITSRAVANLARDQLTQFLQLDSRVAQDADTTRTVAERAVGAARQIGRRRDAFGPP